MREDRLVPAKHEGHWGFWSPQGLFYPLDDAVQVALGGETAWGQAVYQWWDVVLRILSRGQFGPAVDVVGDQVFTAVACAGYRLGPDGARLDGG